MSKQQKLYRGRFPVDHQRELQYMEQHEQILESKLARLREARREYINRHSLNKPGAK